MNRNNMLGLLVGLLIILTSLASTPASAWPDGCTCTWSKEATHDFPWNYLGVRDQTVCVSSFPASVVVEPYMFDIDVLDWSQECYPWATSQDDGPLSDCLDFDGWGAVSGPGNPTLIPLEGFPLKATLTVTAPGTYQVNATMSDAGDQETDCSDGIGGCEGTKQDWSPGGTRSGTVVFKYVPLVECPAPGDDSSASGAGCAGGSCGTGSGSPVSISARDGTVTLSNALGIPAAAFTAAASQQQISGPLFAVGSGCLGEVNDAFFANGCACVTFTLSGSTWSASDDSLIGPGWSITSATSTQYPYSALGTKTYTLTLADGSSFTATAGLGYMDSHTTPDGRTTTYSLSNVIPYRIDEPDGSAILIGRHNSGDFGPGTVTYPDGTTADIEYYGDEYRHSLKKITGKSGSTVLAAVQYYYDLIDENNLDSLRIASATMQSGSGPVRTTQIEYYEGTKKVSRVYEKIDGVTTGVETRYEYPANESIVTKSGVSHDFGKTVVTAEGGSFADRVTTHYYYLTGSGVRSYTFRVVDPEGNTSDSLVYGWLDYFDSPPSDKDVTALRGRIWKAKDATGQYTTYQYYTDKGDSRDYQTKKIIYPDNSYTEYTYTNNYSRQNSNYDESYTDPVRPYTVRDQLAMYTKYIYYPDGQLNEIWFKPSGTGAIYRKTKSYTYYSTPAAINGLTATETVRNTAFVDTDNSVTTYEYQECDDNGNMISGKYRSVPTKTYYQWWNPDKAGGAGYEDKFTWTHYNDSGEVVWTKDGQGNKTSYTYDLQGRSTYVTYPGPSGSEPYKQWDYDCCHLLWERDEQGNKTYYTYYEDEDANFGRLKEVRNDVTGSTSTNPLVKYVYNSFGDKTEVWTYTDASGSARTAGYTYDDLGRVTQIDYPGTDLLASEYYQYNSVGSLMGKKLDDGINVKITAYEYDNMNRLTGVDYDYAGTWDDLSTSFVANDTYEYNGGTSLVTQRVDAAGTSSFEYDTSGRLEVYDPPIPDNWTVEYEYNNVNAKTKVKVKQGSTTWTTSYEYYVNGWLKKVTGPGTTPTVIAEYLYDEAGKPTKEGYGTDGSGNYRTFAQYTYNTKLQLSNLAHYKTGTPDTLIVKSDYTRDNVGSPTDILWDYAGTTSSATVGYDDINRLADYTHSGQSQVSYGYDWVGNRTGTGWGTVNAVDQLPSDPNSNSYSYDIIYGNLATRTKNSLNTTFEYDNYNLLSQITWPGSVNTQFVSDTTGNRVSMTTSGSVSYNFIYDTTAGIPAVLMERDGTETPKLYIRTPDGRLIARVNADSSPDLDFYYHFDGLGSTLALTNSSGNATDTFKYDAWGNVTHTYGSTDQPYQFVGQLGYYTNYQDDKLAPESQDSNKYVMLQLGVRYYAPQIGRFTQRDPMRDGINDYAYVDNNPPYQVDPTGNFALVIVAGCALSGAEVAVALTGLAVAICGSNQECRQALVGLANEIADQASSALQKAKQCCRKALKLRCKPPWKWNHKKRHPFPQGKKICWQSHIHVNCWFDGIGPAVDIKVPYGPCYKHPTGSKTH